MHCVIRLLQVFEHDTRLQPGPVLLPNPCQFQFLFLVHPRIDHARGLFKQHCLNLRPLPQGQGSLRPILRDTADPGKLDRDCRRVVLRAR